MRFYEVSTMFGHVGIKKYVLKTLFIRAANKKIASDIARATPRVKHHNRNVINSIKEIGEQEYWAGRIANSLDPYFHCKCKRDQIINCPDLIDEIHVIKEPEHFYSHYRKNAISKEREKEFKFFRNKWRNKYAKV